MKTATAYRHKEAFCLMKYRSDDGSETETLWNSRDGVTPFILNSLSGKPMQHVEWNKDECRPDFKPPSGMRVFVNATRELVTPTLTAYVEVIWVDPDFPASLNWDTKQQCFDALLPDWLHNGEAPWVITTPTNYPKGSIYKVDESYLQVTCPKCAEKQYAPLINSPVGLRIQSQCLNCSAHLVRVGIQP